MYVDPELPLKDYELQRYTDKIVDIWKRVGLKLGLKLSTLNAIELSNPESAASEMLIKWKEMKNNPPRKVLHQAIDNCRAETNEGMYIVFYNYMYIPDFN